MEKPAAASFHTTDVSSAFLIAMRPTSTLLVAILLCASLTHVGAAQTGNDVNTQRFQLAESYMRSGQHERAITLLEQLYAADPSSFIVFERLRTGYENVKRYDDAIEITRDRAQEAPTPVLWADIARYHHLKGDDAGAETYWQRAINTAPASRSTYQVVYRSMLDVRRLDMAIDVMIDARQKLRDPNAFRTELATLYGATGRYDLAMEENIALLKEEPRQLNLITSRLGRLTEQEEALQSAIQATSRAVRDEPLHRELRELLSWLYLEAGDYDGAFEESRAIDRLEQQEGRLLLNFAQRATSAGAYETARRAYDEIIQRHGNATTAIHAQLGLANVERIQGDEASSQGSDTVASDHYTRSLEYFEYFLDQHPGHPSRPQVLKEIGLLRTTVTRDYDGASEAFTELIERYPNSSEADEARLELGRIDVLRGDLESARLQFSRLVDRLRIGDLAEKARFEIALVHFYRGEFESARAMTDILDVNTSTDVSNDAIELKVVIMENRGPDSLHTPLRTYASAKLAARQGDNDQALELLEGLLAEFGSHRIADEARFARAEALRQQGQFEEAYSAFAEIPLFHPQSHLADRSLYAAASIQHRNFDDKPAAIGTLTRLLTEYPGSLLASDARTLIRRLRGDAL